MATTQIATGYLAAVSEIIETALADTPVEVKADVTTVYGFDIDNTAVSAGVSAEFVYVKGYFKAAGDTSAGIDPDMIIPVSSMSRTVVMVCGDQTPTQFPNALTLRCAPSPGTAGTSAPVAPVTVRCVYQ